MKPDKPNMNLLNSIYELKDVPGMLHQRFLNHGLAGIGDYYLALKFGWEALLKDCRDFVQTQRNAQKALKQLLHDEGKPVRRKINLAHDMSSPIVTGGAGISTFPSFVTYFYGPNGRHTDTEYTGSDIWASARFRYWLPGGPRDVNWTRRMLAAIYGLKPTPAVVYRAIPWTWLVDWFTNIGDVIDNLDTSLVDRLANDYFYVMRHDYTRSTRTCTGTFFRSPTMELVDWSATSTLQWGCKSRVAGDPFGFNTPQNALSGVQLSILGALGLSKLR
jgi:hypothetical protein